MRRASRALALPLSALLLITTAQMALALPPTNDDAADAVVFTGAPFVFVQSTSEATLEPGEFQPSAVAQPANSACPAVTIGATVWFKMRNPTAAQGLLMETAGSTFDTLMAVWADPSGTGANLTLAGCSDDQIGKQSQISLTASAGVTYWVQIGGVNTQTGTLRFSVAKAVPGDNLGDAKPIPSVTYVEMTSTIGATLEAGEARPCGNIGSTVWYSYLHPVAFGFTEVKAETTGSNFNTAMAIWAVSGGTVSLMACSDGSATGGRAQATAAFFGGGTYLFQVGGVNAAQGALKFSLSLLSAPLPQIPSPLPSTPAVNLRVRGNADASYTIYNDANSNGSPDGGEPSVTVPGTRLNPKIKQNPDSTVSVWNDVNGNDQVDSGEPSATSPPPPVVRPKVKENPDGSRTIYNDRNNNDTVDNGEAIATIPRPPTVPRIKVRSNANGSFTVYDDQDGDDVVDPGEEIYTTPAPPPIGPIPTVNPKVTQNPDGSFTIWNDKNSNNTMDAGEEIITVGSPTAPSNDARSRAIAFSSAPGAQAATTTFATTEPGEPTICGTPAATIWYSYTPSVDQTVLLNALGTFTPLVSVYSVSGNTLTPVGCDLRAGELRGSVAFQAIAGTTYLFQIGGSTSSPSTMRSGAVTLELMRL